MTFRNPFARSVSTKAVNLNYSGQVSAILPVLPSYATIADDSVTVIQYQRGQAAACISLISKAVGALPYYLYRVENSETGKYLGKSVKTNPRFLDRKVSKAITKGDYTLAKIFEHPFLDLFEQDSDMSTEEMLGLIAGYLITIGNAYIQVVREGQAPVKFKLLMSEFVSVKYNAEHTITEYVYSPQLSLCTTHRLSPADVIHISRKVPGSTIVGRGILEDAMLSVSVAEEAKRFTDSLLKNHMTPSSSIVVRDGAKTQDEADRIKTMMKEQFSGDNRGKPIVHMGDITVTNTSTKMRDETVLELCEYCDKSIAAQFGVPTDLLDQSSSNRASILSAKNNFLGMTVMPLASSICSQLSKFIAKEYDPSFMLGFDTAESLEVDPVEQATLYKTQIDAGILTVNEARERLGMEPLPEATPGPALPTTTQENV